MNREADLGQVCLLHTRRVRSLPGAVSNPARLHRQHRHLPSQRPPANTTLKGEARLRRGLTVWVGKISLRLPAPSWEGELVLLLQLFVSLATPELCLVPAAGVGAPSQPALGVCHGFPGGTQGQLCLGSTHSPADSCTRGWERGVQCCGMSGVQGVPLP